MSAGAPSRDRRLTPARGDLAAARLRGLVAAERYVEGEVFTVAAELVDLKRAPRPDAPLDTQLLHGEIVTVFDEEEGWAWVQAERDGYVGYAAMSALTGGAIAATHRVAVSRTFVYPAADMKLPVVAALPLDGRVRVVGTSGAFARIAPPGFVFAAHLAPIDAAFPDFVAFAERLVGTPYLWGGKSSLGIDCSGLVQVATTLGGYRMPRDTDLQMKAGDAQPLDISRAELCRGDLVFWQGHVGMMVDATVLVHANGHHMSVAMEPLDKARKRILSSDIKDVAAVRRLKLSAPQHI